MKKSLKRHGDLMLCAVEEIPSQAKKIMSGKVNKLALGEFTGHSHKLSTTSVVDVYELDGARYFVLPKEAALSHEEHKTIKTVTEKPVVLKQWVKKEFDYFLGELRSVRD